MADARNWFPLYVGAYLKNTLHLTTLEHGAYFRLLLAYWNEQGALPDDDNRLSQICGLSKKRFQKIRKNLETFFTITHSFWIQERMEIEIIKAQENVKKQSLAGKTAANARWKKGCEAHTKRTQTALPIECDDDAPSPSPSPNTQNPKKDSSYCMHAVFDPGIDLRTFAIEELGYSESQYNDALEEFIGYWMDRGNTKRARKTHRGWRQAFKTRLRELASRWRTGNGRPPDKPKLSSLEIWAKEADDEEARPN